jgi:hypothetical protein
MLWRVLSRVHLRDIGRCLSTHEYPAHLNYGIWSLNRLCRKSRRVYDSKIVEAKPCPLLQWLDLLADPQEHHHDASNARIPPLFYNTKQF